MISVRIADIPLYLRDGGFYQGLDLEKSDECVNVPVDTVKADDMIANDKDLIHLMTSLQFWSVQRVPKSVIAYVIDDPAFSSSEEADSLVVSFPVLKDLIAIRAIDDETARSRYAIDNGFPDVLRYFHEKGITFIFSACNFAAYTNQVEVLEFLISIGSHIDNLTGAFAAQSGSAKALAYLVTQFPFNDRTINTAAAAGQLECLKVLYAHGYRGSPVTMKFAASSGNLEVIKYLVEQQCEWDVVSCSTAAAGGHLECLKFLHENGCPWDEETAMDAADKGHLDCLIYAHQQGAIIHPTICLATAVRGHLECLKYAHENNFPWDAVVTRGAAEYGMLHTLTYAHENGCPWNSECTLRAAYCQRFDCLKYAVEQGCVWDQTEFDNVLIGSPNPAYAEVVKNNLQQNCTQS